jgi:YHS domain-containing protein
MLRGLFVALISAVFIFGAGKLSFAEHNHSEHEDGVEAATTDTVSQEAVNVGNKVCPVSGEKIDEKLKATYEYEGKIYNFCCTSCVDDFKKDPDKYIKEVNEELESQGKKETKQNEMMPGSEMPTAGHGTHH